MKDDLVGHVLGQGNKWKSTCGFPAIAEEDEDVCHSDPLRSPAVSAKTGG